jgi:hypothetical protein
VPLTNSLYVNGELSAPDTVLVDVGTGFLVEKVSISSLFWASSPDCLAYSGEFFTTSSCAAD